MCPEGHFSAGSFSHPFSAADLQTPPGGLRYASTTGYYLAALRAAHYPLHMPIDLGSVNGGRQVVRQACLSLHLFPRFGNK